MIARIQEERTDTLHVLICKAEDIDAWVAHAVQYDVVTQGNSIGHAKRMAEEACAMVMIDDLNSGREPRDRKAPQEVWDRLNDVLARATRVAVNQLDSERRDKLTYVFMIEVSAARSLEAPPATDALEDRPFIYQAA